MPIFLSDPRYRRVCPAKTETPRGKLLTTLAVYRAFARLPDRGEFFMPADWTSDTDIAIVAAAMVRMYTPEVHGENAAFFACRQAKSMLDAGDLSMADLAHQVDLIAAELAKEKVPA